MLARLTSLRMIKNDQYPAQKLKDELENEKTKAILLDIIEEGNETIKICKEKIEKQQGVMEGDILWKHLTKGDNTINTLKNKNEEQEKVINKFNKEKEHKTFSKNQTNQVKMIDEYNSDFYKKVKKQNINLRNQKQADQNTRSREYCRGCNLNV